LKLLIEIDLDRVHHDSFTGRLDKHEAAKLVESAAARVRGLDIGGGGELLGCSYRIKNEIGATVGSVTIQGDD
jgi:hypothetical protein